MDDQISNDFPNVFQVIIAEAYYIERRNGIKTGMKHLSDSSRVMENP